MSFVSMRRSSNAPPHFCRQRMTASATLTSDTGTSLIRNSIALLRRLRHQRVEHAHGVGVGGVLVDAPFDLGTEVAQQALHRPGGAVAEGADGVAFDLGCDFPEHVDLALLRAAFGHAVEHAPHPAHALAARRALAAALVLVKVGDARHRPHDVDALVHDDHGGGAERGFLLAAAVEIHQQRVGLVGTGRNERHRRAARNDRHQIVPAAAHAAGMALDQFAQWNTHLLFDIARLFHVAGNAEQLGAGVVLAADAGKPGGAAAHDVGHLRNRLDIIDGRRAAIETHIGGERRLEPRLALLFFQTFQKRGLFAADVSGGAVMPRPVEVVAVDVVLADELGLVSLLDRGFQALALANELAANIDVAIVHAHGAGGNQTAFDQEMRIVPHDLAILAGAGLGLVGIDHEIARPPVRLLGHERPFQSGRKTGAAAAALAGGFHLVDDGLAAFLQNRLGAVPAAARTRPVEAPAVVAIEIFKDAVLIGEHVVGVPLYPCFASPGATSGGFGAGASKTLAAAPGIFASLSRSAAPAA